MIPNKTITLEQYDSICELPQILNFEKCQNTLFKEIQHLRSLGTQKKVFITLRYTKKIDYLSLIYLILFGIYVKKKFQHDLYLESPVYRNVRQVLANSNLGLISNLLLGNIFQFVGDWRWYEYRINTTSTSVSTGIIPVLSEYSISTWLQIKKKTISDLFISLNLNHSESEPLLDFIVKECSKNIIKHSKLHIEDLGGWGLFAMWGSIYKKYVRICIADAGIGIRKSLSEHNDFAYLKENCYANDEIAIKKIFEGCSRSAGNKPDPHRGIVQVTKIITKHRGWISIRSNYAKFIALPADSATDSFKIVKYNDFRPFYFPGTQIDINFRLNNNGR